MGVLRKHKTKNFTTINNEYAQNKEMSLKAIGLLTKMFTLPDNWKYSVQGLIAISKEGEKSIQNTLKELEKIGYLKRTKINNAQTGKIEYDYEIYEERQTPCSHNRTTINGVR